MSQKDQPEVIDPDDQRYKNPDHFNKHSQKPYAVHNNTSHITIRKMSVVVVGHSVV
ncbi:hypothetical protein ABLV94_01710 [Staphylococcus sp. Mo2-7]